MKNFKIAYSTFSRAAMLACLVAMAMPAVSNSQETLKPCFRLESGVGTQLYAWDFNGTLRQHPPKAQPRYVWQLVAHRPEAVPGMFRICNSLTRQCLAHDGNNAFLWDRAEADQTSTNVVHSTFSLREVPGERLLESLPLLPYVRGQYRITGAFHEDPVGEMVALTEPQRGFSGLVAYRRTEDVKTDPAGLWTLLRVKSGMTIRPGYGNPGNPGSAGTLYDVSLDNCLAKCAEEDNCKSVSFVRHVWNKPGHCFMATEVFPPEEKGWWETGVPRSTLGVKENPLSDVDDRMRERCSP